MNTPNQGGDPGFDAFLQEFEARHRHPVNLLTAFVADHLFAGGALVALIPALRMPGFVLASAGFALGVGGHLVFERNLGVELREFAHHPLWAVRADTRLIRAIYRGGRRAFGPGGLLSFPIMTPLGEGRLRSERTDRRSRAARAAVVGNRPELDDPGEEGWSLAAVRS